MNFDREFFQRFSFEDSQIEKYLKSAQKTLKIAKESHVPEVIFKFAYDALIKLGVTSIASKGYKIRSKTGHHIKILAAMADLLQDRNMEAVGNMMRRQRNQDLYSGGVLVTAKQSEEYLKFVENVFEKAEKSF